MKVFGKRLCKTFIWLFMLVFVLISVFTLHDLLKVGMKVRIPVSTFDDNTAAPSVDTTPLISSATKISRNTSAPIEPLKHIGFLKVHKAASTTTQAIFLRFGWRRNLTFILPPEKNAFGYPNIISTNESVTKYNTLPPPPGTQFDILAHHVVYGKTEWGSVLPKDAAMIGTVREPISLFNSILNYFNPAVVLRVPTDDKISDYLKNFQKYEIRSPRHSFTNNRMAFEYGVHPDIIKNKDFEKFYSYVEDVLDKVFTVVIVAERFDESLVLMRRKLGWTLDDIMYAMKNVRNEHKPDRYTLKPEDELLLKDILKFDFLLYEFFKKRLDQQIRDEGPSFANELQHFKDVRKYIENFCHAVPKPIRSITVEASAWNAQFEITRLDCEILHRGEISFTQDIRRRQYGSATWQFRKA